jgi:drug/metabolite transporter (DMT)-like permease
MLILASLFRAGNFIVGRAEHMDVAPGSLTLWRWVVALVILLPFATRELAAQLPFLLRNWRVFLPVAITGVSIFNIAAYSALNATEAINAALVMSLTPVVIVLLSWVGFREGITSRQLAGIAISLGGAVALITRSAPSLLLALEFNPGDLWMVIAAIVKHVASEMPLAVLVAFRMIFGLVPMILVIARDWR